MQTFGQRDRAHTAISLNIYSQKNIACPKFDCAAQGNTIFSPLTNRQDDEDRTNKLPLPL